MGEVINYTRLTTSDKLSDRFLTCQVYEPIDPDQAKLGMVISQIEILNSWFPTSQIGQTVINTLIREYYRGNDNSNLVNFENAIKKVNEALAQIAQNGETDWIGRFSGILALVNKDEIHIAQTGQSRAYLFRGNGVNHITEGLKTDDSPHPLKTFTNLTSGTIQAGDKVVVGNSALFQTYSPDELKTSITSYRPTLAAIELARGLKRHGIQNGNAVIFELATKDELANIPPEQKIDTIYLDKSSFDPIGYIKAIPAIISPSLRAVGSSILGVAKKAKKTIAPGVKKTITSTKKNFEPIAKSVTELQSMAKEKFSSGEEGMKASKTELEQSPTATTESQGDHTKNKTIKKLRSSVKKHIFKLKNKTRRLLISMGFYSSKKSKMIATLIFIFLGILILTISYALITKSGRINDQDLRGRSAQITSLSGDASIALSKDDQDTALQKYLEIAELSKSIVGTKYEKDVKEILDKTTAKIKEISRLSIVDPGKEYDIDGNISALTKLDDNLLYYKEPGGVFIKKALEAKFETLVGDSFSSAPRSSVTIENENKLALLLDKKIEIVDTENKTAEEQEVELEGGIKINEFSQNLYILDPGSNQIWKSPNDSGKYKKATGYIKDTTVISSATDLAIDGSVFVLGNDCNIQKLSRGARNAELQISLPGRQSVQNCKAIATTESSSSLLIAMQSSEKTKIVEIKKDGEFASQFELNKSENSKNIVIDAKSREIVVQTDKKILTYKL